MKTYMEWNVPAPVAGLISCTPVVAESGSDNSASIDIELKKSGILKKIDNKSKVLRTTILCLALFTCYSELLTAQSATLHRMHIVAGLSAPELFHAGATYRLAGISLIGLNVGIGPSDGEVWPAISLEHRLYFGMSNPRSNQKTWFCRQGTTCFTSAIPSQQFTFNLTFGKDLVFHKPGNGITIDGGVFYLPDSESSSIILIRSLNLWPALRFELFFS